MAKRVKKVKREPLIVIGYFRRIQDREGRRKLVIDITHWEEEDAKNCSISDRLQAAGLEYPVDHQKVIFKFDGGQLTVKFEPSKQAQNNRIRRSALATLTNAQLDALGLKRDHESE